MTIATAAPSPTTSIEVDLPPAPYPGLRPFEPSEWPIFFGRERIVADLRRRLTRQRLVMVHGSSGCGKSSVIRAGLLPRLVLDQRRKDGPAWRTAIMRPGGSPLWHLSQAIAAATDPPADEQARNECTSEIRRTLNLGVEALSELAARFGLGRSGPVCLLLDQFEELFTYARDGVQEEALTFVEVLRGFTAEAQPQGIHTVLTMRSDHLGDCGRYLGFAELVNRTQYLVPRMDDADLLRAIREPARLYDGEVTLELAMRLIQDSEGEADALPLVQHCLMRLWQQAPMVDLPFPSKSDVVAPWIGQQGAEEASRQHEIQSDFNESKPVSAPPGAALDEAPIAFPMPDSRRVRLLDVRAYTGLRHSLSEHADVVLTKPTFYHVERIERVFRALGEIDSSGRILRRPLRLRMLAAETEVSIDHVNHILLPFRSVNVGFIAPYGKNRLEAEDVVDIGHEALLRCWSRVNDATLDHEGFPNGWLQREQEGARLWRLLKAQADMFDRFDEKLSAPMLSLYDRSRAKLLGSEKWSERYGDSWHSVQALLAESRNAQRRTKTIKRSAILIISYIISLVITWNVIIITKPSEALIAVFVVVFLIGALISTIALLILLTTVAVGTMKKFLRTSVRKRSGRP